MLDSTREAVDVRLSLPAIWYFGTLCCLVRYGRACLPGFPSLGRHLPETAFSAARQDVKDRRESAQENKTDKASDWTFMFCAGQIALRALSRFPTRSGRIRDGLVGKADSAIVASSSHSSLSWYEHACQHLCRPNVKFQVMFCVWHGYQSRLK